MQNKMRQLLQLIVENKDRKKEFRAESTDSGNVIWMHDVIDPWFGVTAIDVGKALEGFGGQDVDVYLNSPGGDVFEGRAIQTRLKAYAGNVTVHIDGLAASAATTVALGADRRIIADGAFFMVHNSWTLGFGDRHELQKTAGLLAQIDDAIGRDYAVATGADHDQITQWMDDESWFSAADALKHGFVHEVFTGDDTKAAENRNAWNLAAYKNVPQALLDKPIPPSEPEHLQQNREHLGRYLDMIERIG